jgi:hypothetical protein
LAKGLDGVHPFSDTTRVATVLQEAENILSLDLKAIGPKNAARIWAFMSKFVMLDQFGKALGAVEAFQGLLVPRNSCSLDYLGSGRKVSIILLNYMTLLTRLSDPRWAKSILESSRKILKKTWKNRETTRAQYSLPVTGSASSSASSVEGRDPASIALIVSRCLIAVVKVKNILNIEAGLGMIAIAMTICSEVCNFTCVQAACLTCSDLFFLHKNDGVFPETALNLKRVLRRCVFSSFFSWLLTNI